MHQHTEHDLRDRAGPQRVPCEPDARAVEPLTSRVRVRHEERQRVLRSLVEVVGLLVRHAGALARAVVAGEVRVALALDVVGHDHVAGLGQAALYHLILSQSSANCSRVQLMLTGTNVVESFFIPTIRGLSTLMGFAFITRKRATEMRPRSC